MFKIISNKTYQKLVDEILYLGDALAKAEKKLIDIEKASKAEFARMNNIQQHSETSEKYIWVKVIASEQDLERCGHKPLISGDIYQAEKVTGVNVLKQEYLDIINSSKNSDKSSNHWKHFYDIFYVDGYVKGVWGGRLKVLTQDEIREHQLNKLGL